MTNLITPHALFSPVFLQRCSVIHESGSDNSFQRYGHSKFSKMAGGRILDLVQQEVGPFDPPSPKTLHQDQTRSRSDDPFQRYSRLKFSKMAASRHLGFGPTGTRST